MDSCNLLSTELQAQTKEMHKSFTINAEHGRRARSAEHKPGHSRNICHNRMKHETQSTRHSSDSLILLPFWKTTSHISFCKQNCKHWRSFAVLSCYSLSCWGFHIKQLMHRVGYLDKTIWCLLDIFSKMHNMVVPPKTQKGENNQISKISTICII